MKIAIDAEVLTFEASGVAKSLLHLINSAKEMNPSLKIITFSTKPLMHRFNFDFEEFIYKKHRFFQDKNLIKKLSECDIVHYHWNAQTPIIKGKFNTIMIHDALPLEIPNYFKNFYAKIRYKIRIQNAINNTHLIFTPSYYSKEKIKKFFKVKSKIVVLPHGITINQNNKNNNITEQYCLYVGGYDKRKGLDLLLKAFIKGYKNNLLTEKLYLTGKINYYSSEFKELIEKAKQQGFLKELGYVDENNLSQLIKNAHSLIYPSKYEGFGLPPLEAMALGCPVITTKYTSIPEVCKDACIYIEPDNSDDIIKAIIKLRNEKIRQDYINKGYNQAANFSWEKSVNIFMEALADTKGTHQ